MSDSDTRPERTDRVDYGEIVAALSVGVLGLLVVLESRNYSMGTIVRVGSGVFPMALGIGLIAISAGLCVEVVRERVRSVFPPLGPFLLVMSGLAAWSLLVDRLGLVVATASLILLASLATRPFNPMRTVLLTVALTGLGYLLFVRGLQIPLTAFGR